MFNAKKFLREMDGKSMPEIQQQFREALVEFISDTRKDVARLTKMRSQLAEDLRILDAVDPAHTASGKAYQLRKQILYRQKQNGELFSRQRAVVEHWAHMTKKFGVSLDEVVAEARIQPGSTFRTLFIDLFVD